MTIIGYAGYDVVPGPFSPMKPQDTWVTLDKNVFGVGYESASLKGSHPLWARLEKQIRAMKRRVMKIDPKTAKQNVGYNDWLPNAALRSMETAEERLLRKTFGR